MVKKYEQNWDETLSWMSEGDNEDCVWVELADYLALESRCRELEEALDKSITMITMTIIHKIQLSNDNGIKELLAKAKRLLQRTPPTS